jgi:hypothetical protein
LDISGDVCVEFFYHMLGQGMGSLSLWIEVNSSSEVLQWSASGDLGDEWLQQRWTINLRPSERVSELL